MTPSQLSTHLRRIAGAIENSRKPSRTLVGCELRRVVAAMEKPTVGSTGMATGQVKLINVKYDPGDERSYGSLKVKAETPHGLLEFGGLIDQSSNLTEITITLDGKDISGTGLDCPDPGLPHFSAPSRLKKRVDVNAQILEAVEEWCTGYEEYLTEFADQIDGFNF